MSYCHTENTEVACVRIFAIYLFTELSKIAFVTAAVPSQNILLYIQTSDDKLLISDTTFNKAPFYNCRIVNRQL